MKILQRGSEDKWAFQVTCDKCGKRQIVNEEDAFTVDVPGLPMPIPSFVCDSCGQTRQIKSGSMPLHVFYRLPHGSPPDHRDA